MSLSEALPAQLQADAQAEADRFYGQEPHSEWQPRDAAAQWWPIAAALAAAVCTAIGVAQLDLVGAPREATTPPHSVAMAPRDTPDTGDPDDDIVDDPPLPASASTPAAVAPAPAAGAWLDVSRRGADWHIEANGASRLLAAQRLAQASGSQLLGEVELLARTRPLDVSWQGRQAQRAWQAVLGKEVSFVTQCSAVRCRVWVLDTVAQADVEAFLPARPIIPLPSVESAELAATAPQPGDSPDPRIAAHHD